MKSLILGGQRSGKSRLAERLALDTQQGVTYVATATSWGDGEMDQRIVRHRQRRPAHWATVEEPLRLSQRLREVSAPGHCVLVDCLTLWLTNLLCAEDEAQLQREREALIAVLPTLPGRVILVSNETGLGVIPMNTLSRRFVDEAGELHQRVAECCEQVIFTVAGLPHVLKGPTP